MIGRTASVFIPGSVADEVATRVDLTSCYVIAVADGRLFCANANDWQPLSGIFWAEMGWPLSQELHYLGMLDGRPCYVAEYGIEFPAGTAEQIIPAKHSWSGLRAIMALLSPTLYELASRALQIVRWHNEHRYCGCCGSATVAHPKDTAKVCPSCHAIFYPRLSPCVMVLITRGDTCLLAHNQQFPAGLFSVLAGFIEAGESVESALHREVYEEVGIRVKNLHYYASQAWPFPSQLMLGFHAEYSSGDICVDGEEITSASWFSPAALPAIPSPTTLSGQLIAAFVDRYR